MGPGGFGCACYGRLAGLFNHAADPLKRGLGYVEGNCMAFFFHITPGANGLTTLGAEVGGAPTFDAIEAAGQYPAGDFWATVVEYLFQNGSLEAGQRGSIEIDPDAQGLYVYSSDEALLGQLQLLLEPLATDTDTVTAFIETATADGFEFN